ncbi:MAG: NB-ARC domain-containing protein, partial [Chloroflexota bacterium]
MEIRETFGEQLQFYRQRTQDSQHNNRPLSQKRMAEELSNREGFTYSYGTISGWERNETKISRDSRLLLKTIIKTLLRYNGLTQLDHANELLRLGGHNALTDAEVEEIYPRWQRGKPAAYSMKIASHEIQRAALPQKLELQGKDDVVRVLNGQLSQQGAPSVLFLSGRGGVGKSAVATALAHHYLQVDIYQAVAWIPLNLPDEQPAEEALEQLTLYLGRWLEIKDLDAATAAGREAMIRGALEAKPHLVVIDGVEAPAHTDILNERLSTMSGRSKFLVTSRSKPSHISQSFVFDLDEIDVAHSQALLQAQTKATNGIPAEDFTSEVAQKIHDSVGGHPLTLILFPHLLKEHSLDNLLNAIESGVEGKHAFIYQRVWEMLSPNAQNLVMGLCFFGSLGADEATVKAAADLDDSALYQAVREVGRFGLLQSRGGLNEKIYNLHNLTIQYVQILVRNAADQTGFTAATKRVFNHWLTHFADPQVVLPFEHVLQLQQALRLSQMIQDEASISQLRCELLYTAFTPLKNHDFLNSWKPYWEFSLANDVAGSDLFRCRLMNQLAFIKQKLREFDEALTLHKEALKLGHELEEALEIAQAHHHMSWCYYRMAQFDLASTYNSRAIEIFEEFSLITEDYVKALLRKGILAAEKKLYEEAE